MSFSDEDVPYRTLPYRPSPSSDQQYSFAMARVDDRNMLLPVINNGDYLGSFDDGKWMDRLLPIYDHFCDFLSPVHYGSLTGALVEVSATVLHHCAEGKEGVYMQVRDMKVLQPGRGPRVV